MFRSMHRLSCWFSVGILTSLLVVDLSSASNSPQILKLTSRPRPRRVSPVRSHRNFLAEKPSSNATEPLLEYFNGTDLQWYGNVSFGTPAQTFAVVFDTGSSSAEIPAVGCKECINQQVFDPNASSTFVDMNHSTVLHFATGIGVDPSDFQNLTVSAVRDTMTILGYSAPDTDFFLITNQSSGFAADPFSGIVGMTYYPEHGLYRVLAENNKAAVFSLYLTAMGAGDAEITLGGMDETKFTGEILYSQIAGPNDIPNYWSLNSFGIFINGKTSPILSSPLEIIFDSGTSNCVFPRNITEAIYALISPNITRHGSLGAYGMPCAQINQTMAELDFTFTEISGQTYNLTIPSSELNLGPFHDDPTTCQTIINALEGYSILGGSLLKHYYSVWDVDRARIGFATNSTFAKNTGDSVLPSSLSFMLATTFLAYSVS